MAIFELLTKRERKTKKPVSISGIRTQDIPLDHNEQHVNKIYSYFGIDFIE